MKNYLVLISFLLILGSCNSQEQKEIAPSAKNKSNLNYQPTVIPADTTKLFIGEGDLKSETALIIVEGGPHNQLNFEWGGKDVWSSLPDYFNYYRAHVHQANTINKSIYDWKHEFTHEMAELEVSNEVEILARTIKYFKDRNKKVIVVGTSWGAILIPHYIATYGNHADTYLISAGRLDATPKQVEYHLKGYNSKFQQDGKTMMLPDTTRVRNPNRGEYYHKLSKVKQYMKGVLGRHRFTQELANIDLSNVVYGYATNDAQVGALTDEELEFLKSKGVPVYTTDKGHAGVDPMLIALVVKGIVKL